MHYYIDGYNLLFRVLKAGDDLKNQRHEITTDLEAKVHLLGIDATLVFDSHYQEDDGTRTHFKSLEIIFTAVGETADDFILHALKECNNPTQHTVVTSDKRLAHLCRLRLAKTESIDEFLSWIRTRCKNKIKAQKRLLKPFKEPEPLPKPSPPPKVKMPREGCFEFYLQVFEAESKKLEAVTPPRKALSSPKKTKLPKNSPLTPEETRLSDTQRWLKIFETQLAP